MSWESGKIIIAIIAMLVLIVAFSMIKKGKWIVAIIKEKWQELFDK